MDAKQEKTVGTPKKIYVFRKKFDQLYLTLKKHIQYNEELNGRVIVTDDINTLLNNPLLIIDTSCQEIADTKQASLADVITHKGKTRLKIVNLIPGKHPVKEIKNICYDSLGLKKIS